MSKPKNRIFCPDCGKQKMLFESESKANSFIKWNKDSLINGDKLRAYYCPACCGWHISHCRYHKNMEGRTDKLIEIYNKEKTKIRFPHMDDIINEIYQELVKSNLKNRKKINMFLKQSQFSHYGQFVKQEAKVKYYTENKL